MSREGCRKVRRRAHELVDVLSSHHRQDLDRSSVDPHRRAVLTAGALFLDLVEDQLDREERERLLESFGSALRGDVVLEKPTATSWRVEGE